MSHEHKEPETPNERRAMIKNVQEELKVVRLLLIPLEKKLALLIQTCPHNMVCGDCGTNDATCPHDLVFGHSHPMCTICDFGKNYEDLTGWYCPDSPDHTCYYQSECDLKYGFFETWKNLTAEEKESRLNQRYVTLLTGLKHMLPSDHDWRHESDDWCIFCGAPEERK